MEKHITGNRLSTFNVLESFPPPGVTVHENTSQAVKLRQDISWDEKFGAPKEIVFKD